ncbi:hypothetical protein [Gimesia chilikensis]|uniref:hypothetical protein n=1 Tax=Gimesia chilikensis TaxID=2605989 RepID=UPI003A9213CF
MSIYEITNLEKFSLSINEHAQPSYSITFQVLTDSLNDSPRQAAESLGVNIGDAFVFAGVPDPRAVCTGANVSEPERIIANNGNHGYRYFVTLTYSQLENAQIPSNPLNSPAEYSFDIDYIEIPIDFDANGQPILNTAGDLFDPTLTTKVNFLRMTVQQNELYYNRGLALTYTNKVNSDAFEGLLPGQCLCESITGQGPYFQDDIRYYKVNYSFALKEDGWKDVVVSTGMRELDDSGNLKNIKCNGSEITTPMSLDINGKAIKDSSGVQAQMEFETKGALPFGGVFSFRK